MQDPEEELRLELVRLRAAMARQLREKLEKGEGVTPAWMDQARKFLTDQGMVRQAERAPRAPAVVLDLPFAEGDGE